MIDASVRLTQGRALPHRDRPATRHRSEPVVNAIAPISRRAGLPLGTAAVLRLQRVHGNQATMRMIARHASPPDVGRAAPAPVVQRYVEMSSKEYKSYAANRPAAKGGGGPTFSAQQLTVDVNKQLVSALEFPNLRIADTGMMATAAAAQPKEFYADQSVIDASNSKLKGVASPLRLAVTGPTLTIPVPGRHQTKQLKMVQPISSDPAGLGALSDKCNEIAADVMGKADKTKETAEAIFAGTGEAPDKTKSLDFHGGSHSSRTQTATAGPSYIAEFLADNAGKAVTPAGLKADLKAGEGTMPSAETDVKYGRTNVAHLREGGKQLGVNEGAMPDVGEAFGTFAIQGDASRPSLDYSKEAAADRMWLAAAERANALKVKLGLMTAEAAAKALAEYSKKFANYVAEPWTWHFAGVVARSGGDAVTLENYNRKDELQKARIEAYRKADAGVKARIEASDSLQESDPLTFKPFTPPIEDSILKAPQLVSQAVQDISDALVTEGKAAIVQNPAPSSLWFFQMYGSKEGQTFHEAMANTGDFTNPLTIRFRDPVTDEFRQKRKDKLRDKAEALVMRHPHGAAKAAINDWLPPFLTKTNTEINQATSKQDVSDIYRNSVVRLKGFDRKLSNLT